MGKNVVKVVKGAGKRLLTERVAPGTIDGRRRGPSGAVRLDLEWALRTLAS